MADEKLAESGVRPKWLSIAMLEADVAEVPGSRDNPRVIEYLQSTTTAPQQWHDETPWCSAFVNWCMREAGIVGTNLANARSWLHWGSPLLAPRLGCIAVFSSPTRGEQAGHVGFYVSETGRHIHVFGGNQHNRVCLEPRERAQLIGFRWPSG